uniref:Putative methyltransferase n=1 Tax=viral metagenome TaxID=1070528 RepID=A0A6M3KVN0_9ZZZZ
MLKNYGRLDNRYFKNKLKKIASYCKGSVLDVGGYTGELAEFLEENYIFDHNYWLIDGDKEALKIAESKGILWGVYMDLNKESIIHCRKFNNIVLSDILDLVLDPDKLLSEATTLSNHIIISVTNDNTIYHRIKVLFGRGISSSPFNIHCHLRHPTFKQWEDFIGKYLVIKEKSYWICFRYEKPLWVDWILLRFANLLPNLFARGAVYECSVRPK